MSVLEGRRPRGHPGHLGHAHVVRTPGHPAGSATRATLECAWEDGRPRTVQGARPTRVSQPLSLPPFTFRPWAVLISASRPGSDDLGVGRLWSRFAEVKRLEEKVCPAIVGGGSLFGLFNDFFEECPDRVSPRHTVFTFVDENKNLHRMKIDFEFLGDSVPKPAVCGTGETEDSPPATTGSRLFHPPPTTPTGSQRRTVPENEFWGLLVGSHHPRWGTLGSPTSSGPLAPRVLPGHETGHPLDQKEEGVSPVGNRTPVTAVGPGVRTRLPSVTPGVGVDTLRSWPTHRTSPSR